MSAAARDVDLVVFDLDGVVYRGETVLPAAPETVAALREQGWLVRFLTNNSSRSRQFYLERMAGMGIPCTEDEIMTSAFATACYFQEQGWTGCAMVVGEEGLFEEMALAGLQPMWSRDEAAVNLADYVVVGLDRDFDYKRLTNAQQAVFRGARFIATNRDSTFPVEDRIIPGGGCMVAAIETAVGERALTIGKPETYAAQLILRRAQRAPRQAVMIGDRVDTDILMGRRAGMWTVMVLTGVGTSRDAERAPKEMRPHLVIPDLTGLPAALEEIRRRAGEGEP